MHNTRLKPISTKKSLHSPSVLTATNKTIPQTRPVIIEAQKKEIERPKKNILPKKTMNRPTTAI